MILEPSDIQALARRLADAHARGEKVAAVHLDALRRILEHTPEDMTVTVEAGLTLAALQRELARHGQWLPIDPPNPERITVGEILSTNASGPRRQGYGTIREHLLGLRVVLADGKIIRMGGKVVKNVAGYDLCKLLVGSGGTLGVIVEAAFKLRPLPEAEHFVQARCLSPEKLAPLLDSILQSDVSPVVLDVHRMASACQVVLGFAGMREDVEWQMARAREWGVGEPSNLDHETVFWEKTQAAPVRKTSVLPSQVADAIGKLGDVPCLARAGNGAIFWRGGGEPAQAPRPVFLMQRIKDAYDPRHILPVPIE